MNLARTPKTPPRQGSKRTASTSRISPPAKHARHDASADPGPPQHDMMNRDFQVALIQKATEKDTQCKSLTSDEAQSIINSASGELKHALQNAMQSSSALLDLLRDLVPETPERASSSLRESPAASDTGGITATLKSWERTFMGKADQALWTHICGAFRNNTPQFYAPYAAIIQSSGTGKSRLVDKLGSEHFVVPMNLRHPDARGFPPSDHALYHFFHKAALQPDKVRILMHAFLIALFETLKEVVSEHVETAGNLHSWFRDFMTAGQTFDVHGQDRIKLFDEVVKKANIIASMPTDDRYHANGSPSIKFGSDRTVSGAMGELLDVIGQALQPTPDTSTPSANRSQRGKTSFAQKSSPKSPPLEPLVVFAFDEAHLLTADPEAQGGEIEKPEMPFPALRSAIRSVRRLPVFFLFLSTTGKITQFTAPRALDPSSRVQSGDLKLVQPFTALGWDQLAWPYPGPEYDFSDIDFHYQVCLGRPMFGSRFEAGESKEDVLSFAMGKLLGKNPDMLGQPLEISEKLACLAQRLPIEFMSTVHTAEERQQVENHLRLCISVDDTFSKMDTVASSEPIVSDAAAKVMQSVDFDAPGALNSILTGFSIHRGDRGEVAALLLCTLARDEAVRCSLPAGGEHAGFFGVVPFLQALFNTDHNVSSSLHFENILDATPSVYRKGTPENTPLRDAFDNVHLHFNHFVKRGASAQHSFDHLTLGKVFARNAAIMGSNSEPGIDIVMVTVSGLRVMKTKTGLVMLQIKNTNKVSASIDEELFMAMDPVALGLIKADEKLEVAVLRIVLTLSGRTPSLQYVHTQTEGNYTAYDIWASGLTQDVYSIIRGNQEVWQQLLDTSHGWKQMYSDKNPTVQESKQSMTPMVGNDQAFWNWAK